MVIMYCLLIKYTLILVYNFLDHFESTKYASIRTLVVIAHSCDH